MLAMARGLATDPAAAPARRAVDGAGAARRRGAVRDRGPASPRRASRSSWSSSSPRSCSASPTSGHHGARPNRGDRAAGRTGGRAERGLPRRMSDTMEKSPDRVEQFKAEIAEMNLRDPIDDTGPAAAAPRRRAARGRHRRRALRVLAVARHERPAAAARRHRRRPDRGEHLDRGRRRCSCATRSPVPALLARPPHLRAEGADRPRGRRASNRSPSSPRRQKSPQAIDSRMQMWLRVGARSGPRMSLRRPGSLARFTSSCGSSCRSYHSWSWSSKSASTSYSLRPGSLPDEIVAGLAAADAVVAGVLVAAVEDPADRVPGAADELGVRGVVREQHVVAHRRRRVGEHRRQVDALQATGAAGSTPPSAADRRWRGRRALDERVRRSTPAPSRPAPARSSGTCMISS